MPAAPARREVTAEQLRDWARSEGFVDDSDTPYNLLVQRVNKFLKGD